MKKSVDVLSINMAIDRGDVEKRYYNLGSYLLGPNPPDVVAVQEVCVENGYPALREIAKKLGPDYVCEYETVYPGQEADQGVAVVTRVPVDYSEISNLRAGGNAPQIIKMKPKPDETLAMVNWHAEAYPLREKLRLTKSKQLDEKLEDINPGGPQIIAGDFNALPFFSSMSWLFGRGFVSTHRSVHGQEPVTWPAMDKQQIEEGRYLTPKEVKMGRILAKIMHPFSLKELPNVTIDYILARNMGAVASAQVIGNNGQAFSDHAALRAVINF